MGVNKIILLGNLGQDPEVRKTPQGNTVCTFNLATGERRKDAVSGNWIEHTEWHKVVVFGTTAENCGKYLAKGKQLYLEGRIQTRKWQDKEGKDRYTTEVIANIVQFIGARGENTIEVNRDQGQSSSAMGGSSDYEMPAMNAMTSGRSQKSDDISFEDDDIPF